MFRKISASLIFVVFVVASVPFFLGLSFGNTFLSPSFYSGTLLDASYDPVVDAITAKVQNIDPVFSQYFSEEEIRDRVQKHFTRDLLRDVVETSLDQFSQTVDTAPVESDRGLRLRLSFAPFVEASGNFFRDLVQLSLERIPTCTADEVPPSREVFPACTLAAWKTPYFKDSFKNQFQQAYEDRMLKQFSGTKGNFSYELELGMSKSRLLSLTQTFDYALLYLAAFLLVFTVIMLIVWMRRWDIGLRWAGSMWMTSAVLGGIFALFILFLSRLVPSAFFGFPSESIEAEHARNFLQVVSFSFAGTYLLFLLLSFLIGLFFFVFARKFDSLIHDT